MSHQQEQHRNPHRCCWLHSSTSAETILSHLLNQLDKYNIIPCLTSQSWSYLMPNKFLIDLPRSNTHLHLTRHNRCRIRDKYWWWDNSLTLDNIFLSIMNLSPIFVNQFILKSQKSNFSSWKNWQQVYRFWEHMEDIYYYFRYFEIKILILTQT